MPSSSVYTLNAFARARIRTQVTTVSCEFVQVHRQNEPHSKVEYWCLVVALHAKQSLVENMYPTRQFHHNSEDAIQEKKRETILTCDVCCFSLSIAATFLCRPRATVESKCLSDAVCSCTLYMGWLDTIIIFSRIPFCVFTNSLEMVANQQVIALLMYRLTLKWQPEDYRQAARLTSQ